MPSDRRITIILVVVLVQMIGASMIIPILPLLAKNEYGLSPQSVTLLAASFFAAQLSPAPTSAASPTGSAGSLSSCSARPAPPSAS